MDPESKARIDRIHETVLIDDLLYQYGYHVRPDAGEREQQFSCDMHGDGQDSKPSARVYPHSQQWYCVSVLDRVLTAKGWVPLGEATNPGPTHDGLSWETPLAYLPRGVREVVRVRTKAGYEVTVTPDHEIEVKGRGWTPAQDLRPGDVLVVPKPLETKFNEHPEPFRVKDLNQRVYKGNASLELPETWSVELGETLGYVFGDGWVTPRPNPSSGVVGITTHASDVADVRDMFKHMKKWAGGRGSESHRTDVCAVYGKEYVQDQYIFTIGNDGFCEFFHRLGLDKKGPPSERGLPSSIWTAPECGIRGFLRGVYGSDGSVFRPKDRRGIKVNLYSVSGQFLRDVQLLLLQFSIHSRLHPPSNTRVASGPRKGRRTHPAGYLQLATGKDILTFRERVGVANSRKQAVLDSFQYTSMGTKTFRPVVVSVEPLGQMEVADLSMPVEHSFVAGGIKVHNCFACGKSRDAIETVKEKEGLTFWQAVRHLERKYNLPTVNWTPKENSGDVFLREQEQQLRRTRSYEAELKRIDAFLSMLTEDKILPMNKVLGLWEARDKVNFLHLLAAVKIDERSAKTVLGKVLRAAQEAVEDLA